MSGTNNLSRPIVGIPSDDWLECESVVLHFFNGIPRPDLHRNVFGGDYGGPIIKDKLFFFVAYQGQRITDGFNGTSDIPVPPSLTDRRDRPRLPLR